jgi:hypothetical protein
MTPDQQRIEVARLDHAEHLQEISERRGYQMQLALSALRGLALANGGAIVALFTFIGNVGLASGSSALLWGGFAVFAVGLSASIAATIFGFFAQGYYGFSTQHQIWNEQRMMFGAESDSGEYTAFHAKGQRAENSGVITAIVSLGCFVVGSGLALAGVLSA